MHSDRNGLCQTVGQVSMITGTKARWRVALVKDFVILSKAELL